MFDVVLYEGHEAIYVGTWEFLTRTGGCGHLSTTRGLRTAGCVGCRARISGWGSMCGGGEESVVSRGRRFVQIDVTDMAELGEMETLAVVLDARGRSGG